jgi:hypothetical protein
MKIRTILSPIDFSDLSARELAIAADVAGAFGARLRPASQSDGHRARRGQSLGLGGDASHREPRRGRAERRMAEALAAVPAGVPAEGVISAGPVG